MRMSYLCCFSFKKCVVVPENKLPLLNLTVYLYGIAPQVDIKFYQQYWLGTFPGDKSTKKSKIGRFILMTCRTIQKENIMQNITHEEKVW